jgi:glycosyltransferase involved in cell wall biosynthesis
MHPRISAIIPAYNRERTIERAVRSALDQRFPPLEVLVVDDGSTDETAGHVLGFGDRVVLVRQSRGGASGSRNRGAREARGEWIAFLDSDDYWLESHFENVARAIRETEGKASFYFSDVEFPPSLGGKALWELCGFSVGGPYALVEDATDWAMMCWQPMMLQASVFRRESYLALGGLREDLPSRHDTHLFLEACIGKPACAVRGLGAKMTDDGESASRVTAEHNPRSLGYWVETERLYRSVLASHALSPRHRRELRYRIAGAQLRLARLAGSRGESRTALRYLIWALATSPRRLGEGLARRVRGRRKG